MVIGRERKRLGNAVGLDQFGVNLTTLKPGAASALRHWHEQEDELVFVLEGEVVLIEDDGETVLKPGDAAGFKANSGVGHQLVNKSNRDAVYLEVGTRSKYERAHYPDSRSDGRARRQGHALHPQERRAVYMSFTNFTLDIGTDGIALVTWNAPGRTMNVIDPTATQELSAIVEQIATDAAVKGAIITSGKDTFCAGADLTILETLSRTFAELAASQGEEAANARFFEESRKWSLLCRRIETCGKPWVAAINGTAVGGGFELALACHYRVAADNPKTRLGLPEIKVGLFPGAGGTQRVARIMQPADALQFLLKGDQISVDRAKALKLIDAVVPAGDLAAGPQKTGSPRTRTAKAPWDIEGFKLPGGPVQSKAGVMVFTPANAIYRRETYDNYPAGRAIMQVVYEGLQLPMDQALRVESRYFAKILRSPEAAAMIRSLFVSLQEINKGARRPAAVPRKTFKKIGVLGAGFMGGGIAYVSALAGLDVVLVDRDPETAEKGKAHSQALDGRAGQARPRQRRRA